MTLRKRLDRLETKLRCDRPGPLVLVFVVDHAKGPVRVTGAHSGLADAIEAEHCPSNFAIIGSGPHGGAAQLTHAQGEAEAAFMRRVEAETLRIHGRLPSDWKAA